MNGFQSAKWCVKNGLFQQAITMLRENFVTLFCERNGLQITNQNNRYIVENALNILIIHKQTKRNKWPEDLSEDQKDAIENVLKDVWFQPTYDEKGKKHNNELIHIYHEVRDYRNNFNHAGFNENSPSPQEIETKVNEYVERTISCFNNLLKKNNPCS